MHTFFESDGEEVQREWVRFTAKIDKKVEAVLHHAVKRSLQELNRLLNGDSKTEVLPVFRSVWVCLCMMEVICGPTLLANCVLADNALAMFSCLPGPPCMYVNPD